MEQWQVILLLLVGVGLLVLAVFFRANYGDKYELKSIDLVLIVLPLLFVLLISGKIKVFDAFGIKADLSELFTHAAAETINAQVGQKKSPEVDELVNMLQMASKGGVRDIPRLIENKTEALVFKLGHGGYYGPAIKQYIEALHASSFLQYLIVTDKNNKLFGIYDALDLAVHFRTARNDPYGKFANWLNQSGEAAKQDLSELPGFVRADQAVSREMSKRDVLKRMDIGRVDSLPVVNKEGKFVGTVDRSQLTASLILDVVNSLDG
ncbi:MAG: CBS domain-containing protein [Pseudomonadales bacterium]|nr:CBS domain-containing protein [Pseudomonadales bacterium]